jgi:hypothetical protein
VKTIALLDDTTQPPAKPAAKPADRRNADAKALRKDMQKVVQESHNPPKIKY